MEARVRGLQRPPQVIYWSYSCRSPSCASLPPSSQSRSQLTLSYPQPPALAFVTDPSSLSVCDDPSLLAFSPVLSSPPPHGDHRPIPHFSISRTSLSSEVLVPQIGSSPRRGSSGVPAWWRDRDDDGIVWRGLAPSFPSSSSASPSSVEDGTDAAGVRSVFSPENATMHTAYRVLLLDSQEASSRSPVGLSYVGGDAVVDEAPLDKGNWSKEKILDVALETDAVVECDEEDSACVKLVSRLSAAPDPTFCSFPGG